MSEKLYVVSFEANIEASSPETAVRVLMHRIQSESITARVGYDCEVSSTSRPSPRLINIIVANGEVIRGAKYTEEVSERRQDDQTAQAI